MAEPTDRLSAPAEDVPAHIARNVEAIGSLHHREERRTNWHQHAIERLTAAVGRPTVLYGAVVAVLGWAGANALAPRFGHRPIDPAPFFWLQGVVSLCAMLVTTMVLITQNRQGRLAQRRAHLDLQVNLLAEQKTAKIIALLEELRRDLPSVRNRRDSEAETMASSANPRAMLQALDDTLSTTDHAAREAPAAATEAEASEAETGDEESPPPPRAYLADE
jgi:uncharacterized membrane protein